MSDKNGLNKVVLLFSGGRDSFLSACYLIERGYQVHMLTFTNGCMSNLDAVRDTALRIIEKYGSDRALFAGIHSNTMCFKKLHSQFNTVLVSATAFYYKDLIPLQETCLCCHTAMLLKAIAYCKVHGISYLATGARACQMFFVELPEMAKDRYLKLAAKHGIQLLYPVYDIRDDQELKFELCERGYIPKTSEAQCWLGEPMREALTLDQVNCLLRYYDTIIKRHLDDYIADCVNKLQYYADDTTGTENYCEI